MRINHIISTLLLGAFMVACHSNNDELVDNPSDKILVSFGMGGEYLASNNAATRAATTFDYYYVAVSTEQGSNGTISSGYVGYFTDLADASIGLTAGTYTFYISAYKQEGYTIDWSAVSASLSLGSFVEVTSAIPYAPDFGDLKVDRYYGNTTQSITENTTISVDGKRFAYGIDVNIEKPIEGKVILSAPSPALNYTVADEALFDSNIFSFAGEDPDAIKSIDITLSYYDASNNLLETRNKTVTITRNHKKTLKVKALDPRGAFDFTIEDGELSSDETVEFSTEMYNGHEYVDLGITNENGYKILWATCNVGATNCWDSGLYFAWGETVGYTSNTSDGRVFNWENYKWCNGTETTMTKYCTNSNYGVVDNLTVLEPSDDAATANWGGVWRIPTHLEFYAIIKKCTWEWISSSSDNGFGGKVGYKVTNPDDESKYIFIPAAGYRLDSTLGSVARGYYWMQDIPVENPNQAWRLYFYESQISVTSYTPRYSGRCVRPVCVLAE